MSKNHKNFTLKEPSGSDRDKIGPTRTRKSHLENRGPYVAHGPAFGDSGNYGITNIIRNIGRFIKFIFRKKGGYVKAVSEESKKAVFVRPENAPKTVKSARSTTRVQQRKGLK